MSVMAKRRSRARARGYTVVEVLSAMTLFAIGAAGVIGMQRVTIQGGVDARNFDLGSNIAREWQHRLQRDALLWTQPNSAVSATNLATTRWLGPANIDNQWRVPAPGPAGAAEPGYAAAFDIFGHDVAPDSPNRMFCVQYRLGWIANSNNGTSPTAIIRAEVRVFWSRLEFGLPNCAETTVEAAATRNQYHFVNLATAIRGNPNQ